MYNSLHFMQDSISPFNCLVISTKLQIYNKITLVVRSGIRFILYVYMYYTRALCIVAVMEIPEQNCLISTVLCRTMSLSTCVGVCFTMLHSFNSFCGDNGRLPLTQYICDSYVRLQRFTIQLYITIHHTTKLYDTCGLYL